LFGEKYGDEVRAISMGEEKHKSYSTELCGGTHVNQTGDIGFFKIVSEGSVSAGVRRVEALAGQSAAVYVEMIEDVLSSTADLLKTAPTKIYERIELLLEEKKKLERDLANAKQHFLKGGSSNTQDIETIKGISVYIKELQNVHPKDMRPMIDQLKQTLKSGIIGLFSVNEGKVSAIVAVTKDLVDQWSAEQLIHPVKEALGAQGAGGREDMAQCGGNDPALISAAIEALKKAL
jgi:alanyl-tRNA synthetase